MNTSFLQVPVQVSDPELDGDQNRGDLGCLGGFSPAILHGFPFDSGANFKQEKRTGIT